MFESIKKQLFKEIVDGQKITIGGLAEHEVDERDFEYKELGGWFDYKPKHIHLELPLLAIKNQNPNNTCVFHSYAACREIDEKVVLSPRSIVLYAKQHGYLKADGLSSIRSGQQAGVEFGIAEETLVPNDNLDWSTYSNLPITKEIKESASQHRGASYFWVKSQNDWLKALDDGHPIHTGFDWYSSYNMSSGFSAPWVLPWKSGWKVGGHAVACIGYDMPKQLFIFQNSFGPNWGDNGKFYVKMSDISRENPASAVTVDLQGDDLQTFIRSHEGADVKALSNPAIYRIEGGMRRAYLDESTFYAFGEHFDDEDPTFKTVSASLLDMIPCGLPMKAEDSPNWPKLKDSWETIRWMRHPENVEQIKTLIS